MAAHRDADGQPLDPHTAAVEVLNVVRPMVAVTWFLTFAAHALHRWPEHREVLAAGDAAYARAFAHEIRRFYPFAPFIGGLAAADLRWAEQDIPAGRITIRSSGPSPTPSTPAGSSSVSPAATNSCLRAAATRPPTTAARGRTSR